MKILVADDEINIRNSIKRYLELEGMEAVCAENGLAAQRMLRQEPFACCLLDLRMPGMDGLSLLRWIRKEGLRLPIVMISGHGEIRDAVEAMKLGASDYIVKPFDPEELTIRLRKVVEDQSLRNRVESGMREPEQRLIGNDSKIERIRELMGKIAQTPSTVLITGESGVGKEIVAREIHARSPFAEGPFVGINIGGVPEPLLESELFGHEKGAFTGAVSRKLGMFELAASGTLFLDEIGDMPSHLQVKLLRILQERRIQRLGGIHPIPIDARIIAATNRDIEDRVAKGEFREDLFYRLNVARIMVPSLRERSSDIPALVGHLIERLNRKMGRTIEGIHPEALDKIQRYTFPGNIRELENIIERAFIFADGKLLEPPDIDIRIEAAGAPVVNEPVESANLKSMERSSIVAALHRWEGNRTKAAEELGISRRTLFNKIKRYAIDQEARGGEGGEGWSDR
jgi:two-component system response regulator AtoC